MALRGLKEANFVIFMKNHNMENNLQNISTLLAQVAEISKKYDLEAQKNGNGFNVFSIMSAERWEVNTHSAIIGELLNPNGSHGKGDVYLKLLIEAINKNLSINIESFSELIDERVCERTINNSTCEIYEGGRIDIVLEDATKIIIIENKIYAENQPFQLIRYYNYAKKLNKEFYVFYLKPFEFKDIFFEEFIEIEDKESKKINKYIGLNYSWNHEKIDLKGNNKSVFYPISYEKDIKEWIEKCIEISSERSNVVEVLKQYLLTILNITNQTTNHNMANEIIENIISNKNNIRAALEIAKNIEGLKDVIRLKFIVEIESKIKENKNIIDVEIVKKCHGLEIFKSGVDHKNYNKVALYFEGNESLMLGVYSDVKLSGGELIKFREEKFSDLIQIIGGTPIKNNDLTWIHACFLENEFENRSWEDILDTDNINTVTSKIEKLYHKLNNENLWG